jgi:colicin import membrane protein
VRRHIPRRPGWLPAAVYAVLLHAILIALLVVSFRVVSRPGEIPAMQATVVRDPAPELEQARQEEERKRKEAEAKKVEDERKREETAEQARQEAEHKKQEEEKKKEEDKKKQEQEQERRKKEETEKKKQADAEKRKRDDEQKKQQEQRKKQAEETLREQLAEEEKARSAAKVARAARMAPEVDKYKAAIRQKVERNWIRPASSRKGLQCTVHVRQAPGGEVLEAKVVRSSGDPIYDRSVENAVYKASPLPTPPNPEVFDRDIEFIFRPED